MRYLRHSFWLMGFHRFVWLCCQERINLCFRAAILYPISFPRVTGTRKGVERISLIYTKPSVAGLAILRRLWIRRGSLA